MSTLLGFILQRLGVTMFPDVLKRRSDGQDVVQAHKYFLASLANKGYSRLCYFHQFMGSSSKSNFDIVM